MVCPRRAIPSVTRDRDPLHYRDGVLHFGHVGRGVGGVRVLEMHLVGRPVDTIVVLLDPRLDGDIRVGDARVVAAMDDTGQ